MVENAKAAAQPYLTTLKLLLGVRTPTCTDILCIESGRDSAIYIFREDKNLRKLYASSHDTDSPAHMAIEQKP